MSGQLPNTVKKYSLSPNSSSNDCLDLSVRGLYVLAYIPGRDVGSDYYEIISSNELEGFREPVEIGTKLFGKDQEVGEVIAVSEKRSYLSVHFNSLTTRHRQQLEEKEREAVSRYMPSLIGRRVIKIAHTEAQTDIDPDDLTDEDWMRKYDELKSKIAMVQTSFSVVEKDLLGCENNLANTVSDESHISSPSTSYYSSDEETKPVLTENCTTPILTSNNMNNDCMHMVTIGSHGTVVPKHVFETINWSSHTTATRKLLVTLFSREVLASHSLTGKPSPAFLNSDKQKKIRLDPVITSDIVEIVSQRCKVPESLVRYAITTKCADENKLYRQRLKRKKMLENDENNSRNEKKPNFRC